MFRSNVSVSTALFAVLVCLGSAGCDNSATTYACADHAGLEPQPAEGATVQLLVLGGHKPLIGVVTTIDADTIQLQTSQGEILVVRWKQVWAWQEGESVRLQLERLERFHAMSQESAESSE